jgi:membrane dipeptidase
MKKAFIFDLVSPLIAQEKYIKEYLEGEFSIVGVTLAVNDDYKKTLATIQAWQSRFEKMSEQLVHVRSIKDIQKVIETKKLGIIFHLQNTAPLDGDIHLIKEFFDLGVRVIQLTYNTRNIFGCGCECEIDTGLTELGYKSIDEMNKYGMLLDLSHAGYRTAEEALNYSKRPIIFSHSNVYNLCPSDRNVPDKLIKLLTKRGGCIGVNAFSPLVTKENPQASLSQFLDHIDYIRDLIGIEYISLGLDYYTGQWPYVSTDVAIKNYESLVEKGVWNVKNYPKPPHKYVQELETPRTIGNLEKGLIERGYEEKEIAAILGENLLRLFCSHLPN